jgi:CheY-like chemotaxis protein
MASALDGKHILIVEDEADLRELIVNELLQHGCQAYEATNGLEAIEIAERCPIDLVLTDIKMPALDGITLLEELKSRNLVRIPLMVIMTGYCEMNDAEIQAKGAIAVLHKPFRLKELSAFLAEIFQERMATQHAEDAPSIEAPTN